MSAADTDLAAALRRGDRRALARAITLAESTRPEDRVAAEALLASLLPETGQALRLGVSGAPGAGKSTFIDAYGRVLLGAGHCVAVLAIDPSSKRGGGALLGDKTRMPGLAKEPGAFIRPSPAGTMLGGVARRTREAILLAEAAGFDRVIVETVGVGQSESDVADMVDLFLVLVAPGGGDELQGLKRGNLELADFVIVTKCDGDLEPAARRAAADYGHALHLLRGSAPASVAAVSALMGAGMAGIADALERRTAELRGTGALAGRRARQAAAALWREIGEGLLAALEAEVAAGRLTPAAAAGTALAAFLTGRRSMP
jgi:LAO/AO transport system kinase